MVEDMFPSTFQEAKSTHTESTLCCHCTKVSANSKSTHKGLKHCNLGGAWKAKGQCSHKLQKHADASSKLPEQG